MRVTWYSIDLDDLADVYTAAGVVKDGVIGEKDHAVYIYDREISKDEIVSNSSTSNNKTTGIGSIVIGLIGAVICLILLFKKN